MGIVKWGAIGAAVYLLFNKMKQKAEVYFSENMTFAIAGGRIHKISLMSIELRINIDFTNLTPAQISMDRLLIDAYYIKPDGTPDLMAKSTLSSFTIPPNETSRINDIKVVIPTTKIITNREIITAPERKFKFVIKPTVGGKEFTTSMEYTF